ncbi:hypothetical protein HOO68_02660 [Candidatus Gracilibacteria bacterium]|nr:hypothetical protein [Candidatus Gracilibacteria bacterium]
MESNESNIERKKLLDNILEKNQTTIVGNGYVDIIIPRSNYIQLINELVINNFIITYITWWEYCTGDKFEPKYGMGGPKNKFGDGWYSEICMDFNEIKTTIASSTNEKEEIIDYILSFIENTELHFYNESITFKDTKSLTPAVWLDVPDDWKNI